MSAEGRSAYNACLFCSLVQGEQPRYQVYEDPDFMVLLITLENGADWLSPRFARVTLHRYDDALVIRDAAPLIAYVLSSFERVEQVGERRAAFERYIQQQLAAQGVIRIGKDSGLFEAWRDA